MKHITFKIPIYDYTVDWVNIDNKEDYKYIDKIANRYKIEKDYKEAIINNIKTEQIDGGETYRNLESRRFFILIYECKNKSIQFNIINHEKRHLVDRIMEHCDINDIEASAYLDGYISALLYNKGIITLNKTK
jgi:hypothetical protein